MGLGTDSVSSFGFRVPARQLETRNTELETVPLFPLRRIDIRGIVIHRQLIAFVELEGELVAQIENDLETGQIQIAGRRQLIHALRGLLRIELKFRADEFNHLIPVRRVFNHAPAVIHFSVDQGLRLDLSRDFGNPIR